MNVQSQLIFARCPVRIIMKLSADFEQLLTKLKNENPQFTARLAVIRDCPALETTADSDFVKAVCRVRGVDIPGTVGYTTDGPYFRGIWLRRL